MVRMPAASNAAWVAAPTPHKMRKGLGRRKSAVSASPMIENPRGLSRSDAILARNLLCDSPIDPVTPTCTSICCTNCASITAGGAPCRRAVPVRSKNASSSDRGSMAGVNVSIKARIWREVST